MRLLPLALLAAGCTGNTVEFPGTNMTGFFEFQENLGYQWQFASDDTSLDYRMVSEIEDYLIVDGKTHYTMVYRKDCINPNNVECPQDEVIRTLTMSSDFSGVLVYGVDDQTFDPPIVLSEQFMKVGDSVTTGAYTSSMPDIGECPVRLPNWTNCAQFDVTGGDTALVGTYWAIQNFNIVAIEWADQPGRWELSNHVQLD